MSEQAGTPQSRKGPGCGAIIGGIVGTLILVSALIQTCESQRRSSGPKPHADFSHAIMTLNGQPRTIDISWAPDGGTFEAPKTYELSGTHIATDRDFLSCEDLRKGHLQGQGLLALEKELSKWTWLGPQKISGTSTFTIVIPINTIPRNLSSDCLPFEPGKGSAPQAQGSTKE